VVRFAIPGAWLDYTFTQGTKSTSLWGDVDLDGEVSIADVSFLIDLILNGIPSDGVKRRADLNGDGEVTVSDVTELIDYILNK